MKLRDLSLIAIGALAAAALTAAVSAFVYTPRAQAQGSAAAPAPGGVSMIITEGSASIGNSATYVQGGTIVMQDSVNRKVTVYAFEHSFNQNTANPPIIQLSTNTSFTY